MDQFEVVFNTVTARQHVSPKRLADPGPDDVQIDRLFLAAAAAPDHGTILPWRFVVISKSQRERLAEAFALALTDRDPGAQAEQIAMAREKAFRAPLLAVAIVRLAEETAPEIPNVERIISLGAALQNIMLCATAMGFGSGLTSGKAMESSRIRDLFGLAKHEQAVCFINVGTITKAKPVRIRPSSSQVVTSL